MQIFMSKAFASAISNKSKEEVGFFNEEVNVLKEMNKTDIINLDKVIELTNSKNMVIYAYNIRESIYVLFAFKSKNEMVIFDEFELLDGNKLKSLVYPDLI